MKDKVFYHGTSYQSRALKILEEGIRPDLSTTQGLARPVEGRIYMATNLKDSLPYLLGGAMCGHDLPPEWIKESRYGYLFLIKGSDLIDVQPDEDQVGQAICDGHFSWVSNYEDYLAEQEPVVEDSEESWHSNLLSQARDGEYAAWIKCGHLLLPRLSQSQKEDVMNHYGNVAHLGVAFASEAWKFDKLRCKELLEDGSNFFEIAEKIL